MPSTKAATVIVAILWLYLIQQWLDREMRRLTGLDAEVSLWISWVASPALVMICRAIFSMPDVEVDMALPKNLQESQPAPTPERRGPRLNSRERMIKLSKWQTRAVLKLWRPVQKWKKTPLSSIEEE
eukprot:801971-Rhodomonas_salina.2